MKSKGMMPEQMLFLEENFQWTSINIIDMSGTLACGFLVKDQRVGGASEITLLTQTILSHFTHKEIDNMA